MAQRTVTPGSRQAPDPHDQFLEKMGFYRKHTGRDSSNLFRVISEQLYDTQKHHSRMREECVAYMKRYREFFKDSVDGDFDNYLMDLSKLRTYGGLLELRALAARYRRNIFLFQSFDNNACSTGNYLDYNPDFSKDFRVFFTPGNHFDTVYPAEYMENLAFCQALAFEILYRGVFKLPDINYAVERMLHDPEGVTTTIEEDPSYTLCGEYRDYEDHRKFFFDRPEMTNCVLNNRDLCNFHNPRFDEFVAQVKREEKERRDKKCQEGSLKSRTLNSLLPVKEISCVCQLLNAQITPFPYKVAKSLDPYIYRNVDFDVWADMKKEQRLRRWDHNLRVGDRCSVKLYKSQDQLYNCYIQDMKDNGPCLVFIEELGEHRRVPMFHLQPLNSGQWKPWMVPLNPRSNGKRSRDDDVKKETMMQLTSMGEMKPYPVEMVAMPALTNHHGGKGGGNDDQKKTPDKEKQIDGINNTPVKLEEIKSDQENELEYFQEMPYAGNPSMYYSYDPMTGMYMMPQPCVQYQPYYSNYLMYPPPAPPLQSAPVPIYQTPTSISTMSVTPPNHNAVSPSSLSQSSVLGNSGRRRDGSPYYTDINYNAMPSTASNISDLPLYDLPTLQFFYNAGIDYFAFLRSNYGLHQAIAGICELQGLPPPQMPLEIEENYERGAYAPPLPNIKIDDAQSIAEAQHNVSPVPPQMSPGSISKMQENYQLNTPQHHHSGPKSNHMGNHSGQSSGGRNSNHRHHRKETMPRSATKKHNQYHGKHQSENHGKTGGHNRGDSGVGGSHGEKVTTNAYLEASPSHGMRSGEGDISSEAMYSIPPPSSSYYGYQPLDGEPSSPVMNPYGTLPYYNPNQGMPPMQMFSLMPPPAYPPATATTATSVAPPIQMAQCICPDMTVMPPPIYPQAQPRGAAGGGSGNGMEMGNFLHHNGPSATVVGGGAGVPRGSEGVTTPYCVIPPPNSFQCQPPPPLINAPPTNRPPGNWYQITTSRPPPPTPTTVVSHNNGNMASGIYTQNTDIPH